MTNERDIEKLIKLLDSKAEAGVSRINVNISENVEQGNVLEIYHHGRCDVGSPWAKGTVINFDCDDRPDEKTD